MKKYQLNPEDIKTTKFDSGYIFPNGDFYACHREGHYWLADKLMEEKLIQYNYSDRIATEKASLLKLTFSYMVDCEFLFPFTVRLSDVTEQNNKITPQQIQAIINYKKSRGEKE